MQALPCDGGCGGQGQVMITVIETGDALSLCWGCTADWGKVVSDQRDQAVADAQAGPELVAEVQAATKPAASKRPPTPRGARRRRTSGSAAPFPSIVSGASTPADSAGHDDGMEHRPTNGTDIAGHNADDIATVE